MTRMAAQAPDEGVDRLLGALDDLEEAAAVEKQQPGDAVQRCRAD
jgi:hypothetical protein